VKIELVPGTTLEQARKVTQGVADLIMQDKDVVDAAFSDINPTSADIYLTLRKDQPDQQRGLGAAHGRPSWRK
jgi:hypothetical protein